MFDSTCSTAQETFDPYHFWLGIPPQQQPPSHYCLLGIEPFESNPEVIENAADQRMVYLRFHQTGDRGGSSQQLLNEVAAARTCLLRPESKAAYDECLRRQSGDDGAECSQNAASDDEPAAGVASEDVSVAVYLQRRVARERRQMRRVAMLGLLVLSIVGAMFCFVWSDRLLGNSEITVPDSHRSEPGAAGNNRSRTTTDTPLFSPIEF